METKKGAVSGGSTLSSVLSFQPCILPYRVCSRSLRTADVFPSENSSISGRPSNSHIQN